MNAGERACGMNAGATFDGVFVSRETAQEYGIAVKNLMNLATGTVTKVSDLRLASEPAIERAIVKRDPDQATAGEVRVWRLTIALTCTIGA